MSSYTPDHVEILTERWKVKGLHLLEAPSSNPNVDKPGNTTTTVNETTDESIAHSATPLIHKPQALLSTRRPYSYFNSPSVTVLVGGASSPSLEEEPVTFHVHADLLTKASAFFKAIFGGDVTGTSAVKSGFLESRSRTVTLPEDRPEDIAYLLQYLSGRDLYSTNSLPVPAVVETALLYHKLVDESLDYYVRWCDKRQAMKRAGTWRDWSARRQGAPMSTETGPMYHLTAVHYQQDEMYIRPQAPAFGPLFRLYILADKYDIQMDLRPSIIRRVQEVERVGKCVPEREDLGLLWDGILEHESVGLKRAVIDMWAGMGNKSAIRLLKPLVDGKLIIGEQWNQGFLLDLNVELFRRKPTDA